MRSTILGGASLAALMLAAAAPAAAQTATATGGVQSPTTGSAQSTAGTLASADGDSGLEEIIVTAQRRAENIQDVSIAIQAITGEGLARSGITDVTRLELITPGVTFARYGADSKISLRGANSNNTFLDSAPSVGVFVDGVYRPRAAQQSRAFFDVNRIEVLKGPQGTLYGRNTLAGAVNLWTNVPDADAFAAGVTASYERFNAVRAEGFINVPLSDSFAVRFAGLYERSDGWVENLAGEDLGSEDTVSLRGSARYESGDFDATLRVTYIRERGNQTGLFAQTGTCRTVTAEGLTDPFGPNLDCRNPRRGAAGSTPFDQLGRLQVLKEFVHEDKIDELNATLEINAPLGENFGIKGIFSYTDFDLDVGQDNDFSEIQFGFDFLRERVKSYTSEIQVSTTDDTSPFQVTVGGYASKDDITFNSASLRVALDDQTVRPQIAVPGFPGVFRPRLDPTPVIDSRINVGDPLARNAAGLLTRNGQSSNNFQYLDTVSLGLFGQASYEIVTGLRIVGGVRYSRDEKDAINYGGPLSTTSYVGPQFPTTAPRTIDNFSTDPALATARVRRNYSNVTWRGAVEYDVNDDVLLFAQASTGFLSGSLPTAAGVTATSNCDGCTDDQKSINYEGGIKSRFLDNRLQFNASIYYTEYKNLITSFQRPNNTGGVDTISVNGGKIKATGFEAVIEAVPVDDLRLTVGISILDSEFGNYSVLAPQQLLNGDPTITGRFINLKGGRPQFAPKFTLSAIAAYDIDLGTGGKLTPQVQFYYSDRYSSQTQLSFVDRVGNQPSFTKTDLRISWRNADDRFGIEGFVENLENEIVKQRTTAGGDGIEQITYGYPRNYGVRVSAKF